MIAVFRGLDVGLVPHGPLAGRPPRPMGRRSRRYGRRALPALLIGARPADPGQIGVDRAPRPMSPGPREPVRWRRHLGGAAFGALRLCLRRDNQVTSHASLSFAYHHPWPQHGRRAGIVARDRHEGCRFGKPIIAVVNSFTTNSCPGTSISRTSGSSWHARSKPRAASPRSSTRSRSDDGIAMGHDGMLYSLPSREIIADSVEYMANAHCADAMVCISNCDKITPGMLMAALRLNIPAVFVSGGPMEAGKANLRGKVQALDLVDAMVAAADDNVTDEEVQIIERSACPTCGSCSGMFTANSMNCLTEALGLALPGNGSTLATHADRRRLFVEAGHLIVDLARRYYEQARRLGACHRAIANFEAFENAMTLDIAMGGSTNTVLHLLAAAHEGEGAPSPWRTSTDCRAASHACARSRPPRATSTWRMCTGPAASWRSWASSTAPACSTPRRARCTRNRSAPPSTAGTSRAGPARASRHSIEPRRGACRPRWRSARSGASRELDLDRETGVIRDKAHAFSQDGGLAVLYGNLAEEGCIVKTAGVDSLEPRVQRHGAGVREPGCGRGRDPGRQGRGRAGRADPLRGAARWPGHAGDALSDELSQIQGARQALRPRDRRPLLGRIVGPVDRSCLARSGGGRNDRAGARRRPGSTSTSPTAGSTSTSPTRTWRTAGPPRWTAARTRSGRWSCASARSRRR